jgi:DNA-directed RNA polymerase specialized sigma24 family protein
LKIDQELADSVDIPFLTEEWLITTRQKLIRFFAVEGCCHDPESNTDETMLRVVRAIATGTTIHVKPSTFAYGVAKRVAMECRRKTRMRNEVEFDHRVHQPLVPDNSQADSLHACLDQCLQGLSGFERSLIIKFYEGTKAGEDMRNRKALAALLGMPVKKLRKEAMKIRQKLERCISGCIDRK